jgi:hypothetical protein
MGQLIACNELVSGSKKQVDAFSPLKATNE